MQQCAIFRGFGKYSFQSYGKVSCLYDHHQNSFKNSDQNSQEKQIYQNIGFILQFQSLFRYRESDPKSRNWLELPINPPDARKVKIHNLTPRTKYEFQVIGENEFGDGMYSAIIEAQTKGKYFDNKKIVKRQFHITYQY